MVCESEYQSARKKPRIRQEFLDRIYKSDTIIKRKYARKLAYTGPHPKGFQATCKTPFLARLGIRGFRSRILIHEKAFHFLRTPQEFESVLRHENQHAKDHYENPGLYASGLFHGMRLRRLLFIRRIKKRYIARHDIRIARTELRACKLNLDDIRKNPRRFSPRFKKYLLRKIEKNREILEKSEKLLSERQ